MGSNFERLHEIKDQAYAENFSILTLKMVNPLLNPSLHFLIGIPFLWPFQNVRTLSLVADNWFKIKRHLDIVWRQCDIQIDFDDYFFFIFQSPPMLESFHLSFENLTMSQVTPTQQLITYQ